jgi:hypothetical protein
LKSPRLISASGELWAEEENAKNEAYKEQLNTQLNEKYDGMFGFPVEITWISRPIIQRTHGGVEEILIAVHGVTTAPFNMPVGLVDNLQWFMDCAPGLKVGEGAVYNVGHMKPKIYEQKVQRLETQSWNPTSKSLLVTKAKCADT